MALKPLEEDRPCLVVDAHTGAEWPDVFPDLLSARARLKRWREEHRRSRPGDPFHGGIVWADQPKRFDPHTGRFYWEAYAQYPVGWGVESAVPKVEWRPRVDSAVLKEFTAFCKQQGYDRPRAVRSAVARFGQGEFRHGVPTNQRSETTKLPMRIEASVRAEFEDECRELGLWYSVALNHALKAWMADPTTGSDQAVDPIDVVADGEVLSFAASDVSGAVGDLAHGGAVD